MCASCLFLVSAVVVYSQIFIISEYPRPSWSFSSRQVYNKHSSHARGCPFRDNHIQVWLWSGFVRLWYADVEQLYLFIIMSIPPFLMQEIATIMGMLSDLRSQPLAPHRLPCMSTLLLETRLAPIVAHSVYVGRFAESAYWPSGMLSFSLVLGRRSDSYTVYIYWATVNTSSLV